MTHKVQTREDRERGRFKKERSGLAASIGHALTRVDYENWEKVKAGLRKHWLWYFEEMTEADFRAIVRARINQAKGSDAQANKATEILWRYALGSEPPSDHAPLVSVQILAQELNAYFEHKFAPDELSAEEAEVIEALPEGDWVLAAQGPGAGTPQPSEEQAGSGRRKSRKKQA